MSFLLGLLPTTQAEIVEVVALLQSSASIGPGDINPSVAISSIRDPLVLSTYIVTR